MMKKGKYIIIIIVLMVLAIITLIKINRKDTTVTTNYNEIQITNEVIEQNNVNYTRLPEEREETIVENKVYDTHENLIITNNVIEVKENTVVPNSTKANKETKQNNQTVNKQKNTQEKGNSNIKSNTSTTTDSTSSKTWNANTSYGGEIYDKDGATGSYWLQGEEIDLKDIDMSDWTIK